MVDILVLQNVLWYFELSLSLGLYTMRNIPFPVHVIYVIGIIKLNFGFISLVYWKNQYHVGFI